MLKLLTRSFSWQTIATMASKRRYKKFYNPVDQRAVFGCWLLIEIMEDSLGNQPLPFQKQRNTKQPPHSWLWRLKKSGLWFWFFYHANQMKKLCFMEASFKSKLQCQDPADSEDCVHPIKSRCNSNLFDGYNWQFWAFFTASALGWGRQIRSFLRHKIYSGIKMVPIWTLSPLSWIGPHLILFIK